ncbi:DUF5107 domain-containing protein [Paenibacillus sp. NPDC056933]|uniref:DUF5107 domain-containing protein n=1 Tax=Paenibacillus sp. NPDC056933 TaxID=3345968 RepID=UPI00364461A9
MNHITVEPKVRVWEESRNIPTYGTGKPDQNPMFLEKRIYQGSSGKVYPLPVVDRIDDEVTDQPYRIIILENEYVRIEMMPELGGRIYRALDLTNDYDFVYYNRVIKPALVGLAGPWISGGIEFNWPQHHRPNTFGPVDCTFSSNEDGSATVWIGEIDRMYGTKMTAGFTLHPGKAYLAINAEVYNRTHEPQTFLWWANPAVAVNDHTQSVFPPDVTAVLDHGKRDVSRFPIATGTYYKMDYSEGVDISRYKNIPVPTSYMAYKSDYNFVGGYDHSVQAGLLHVANHHVSPGKKQWTWGNGAFGQAWDRQLTDEDGPYIELMTGVFTDNQPDFTWLQPYESKSFSQYFMPYKGVGMVKNATIDAAVNLELDKETGQVVVSVYATSVFADAAIELKGATTVYLSETCTLSPTQLYKTSLQWSGEEDWHQLMVTVRAADGRVLVSYQSEPAGLNEVPEAAKPLPLPTEIRTNEQLYLAGLHIEQYRHATYEPESYYLEGLKRDPGDIRHNIAYGTLLLRRGSFQQAEVYFRQAVQSLSWKNTNPYDSESFYQLGLCLKLQGRHQEAYKALYKAVWSAQYQDSGYLLLAQIDTAENNDVEALELIERSLIRNTRNYKARHLKVALLRRTGREQQAMQYARDTLELDPIDFGTAYELVLLYSGTSSLADHEKKAHAIVHFKKLMRGDVHNYMNVAADYAESGLWHEALGVLAYYESEVEQVYPMVYYAQAYLHRKAGDPEQALQCQHQGKVAKPNYCFPNSLFELLVLLDSLIADPFDARAHYYVGNWLYDKKRYKDAITHWETSREVDPTYPTVHRNLGLAYYNKLHQPDDALVSLEEAFRLNPADARVFYELDQLHKKRGSSCKNRIALLERHMDLVHFRDDLYIEWVTLLNMLGRHQEAWNALQGRHFHPWEGGEGKVTGQYVMALTELAKQHLAKKQPEQAVDLLKKSLIYPHHLGEGKLEGAGDNPVYFYLGCAYELMNNTEAAKENFLRASIGLDEPASAMFYNDQPPEWIYYQGLAWERMGNSKEAKRRFNKLIDYAERHMHDHIRMDYFAVSLPDFLVFEDNLDQRNEEHCRYMRALGLLGLGRKDEAGLELERVLEMNPNHQGAYVHR